LGTKDEILRVAQDDKQAKGQVDKLEYLTVEFSCLGVPAPGMGFNGKRGKPK
jgi:hypothetical protein